MVTFHTLHILLSHRLIKNIQGSFPISCVLLSSALFLFFNLTVPQSVEQRHYKCTGCPKNKGSIVVLILFSMQQQLVNRFCKARPIRGLDP